MAKNLLEGGRRCDLRPCAKCQGLGPCIAVVARTTRKEFISLREAAVGGARGERSGVSFRSGGCSSTMGRNRPSPGERRSQ